MIIRVSVELLCFQFFFFNDPATPEIYTLSLHDALPISRDSCAEPPSRRSATLRCSASRRPDRKSTRLNSSHSQISYAVFCLKKKKKDISELGYRHGDDRPSIGPHSSFRYYALSLVLLRL